MTHTVSHCVSGENGNLLTPLELESELPKFIDVEFIYKGEKLPFYDVFMAGNDHMASSSENCVTVQISTLRQLLPTFGHSGALRGQ